LRTDVLGNESVIVDQLEHDVNDQTRRYLLALLSESKSEIALRALRGHVHDKDAGARSWARFGVEQITGERFQTDYRDIEEAEARLVNYPVRWRVYLVAGSLTVLAYGLGWTLMVLMRVALGWSSDTDLVDRLLSGWGAAMTFGLFAMVLSGERYRTDYRILVNEETIVGPKSNGKIAQIRPENVQMTPYEGGNWLRKVVKTWILRGGENDKLFIPTMFYQATDIDKLCQAISQ